MFTKGQKVAKLFTVMGVETVSIQTIARASKTSVQCKGDDLLRYDAKTGLEINPTPAFRQMGITSRLIAMDGE